MILDEPTSALDEATEWQIVEELEKIKGRATIILIAHKSKLLGICDRLVKIESGRLTEHPEAFSVGS